MLVAFLDSTIFTHKVVCQLLEPWIISQMYVRVNMRDAVKSDSQAALQHADMVTEQNLSVVTDGDVVNCFACIFYSSIHLDCGCFWTLSA